MFLKKDTMKTWLALFTPVLFAIWPAFAQGQLLKGSVSGEIDGITIAISLKGTVLSTEYRPVEINADGTFAFDTELAAPFNDVVLEFNQGEKTVGTCGAHLVAGETLSLTVACPEAGKFTVQYDGKYKELSEFYGRFAAICETMQYANGKSYEENRQKLAAGIDRIRQQLPLLKEDAWRDYYTRSLEAAEKQVMYMLWQGKARAEKKNPGDYPEYRELLRSIDINDELGLKYGLSTNLVSAHIAPELFNILHDMTPYAFRFMEVTDSLKVSSAAVRRDLCNFCAFSYFTYGKGGDYQKFWNRFQEFSKEFPEVIAEYAPRIEAMNRTRKGREAYDAVLTDPEGKNSKLSDFFGKVLYIDVWATWCGPCCAEIPHLEKVAEHYRGNDRIQILSLSTDTNVKAWKDKLEKDKPDWPQFRLEGRELKQFMANWGISGIPRFILIDKRGKIYNGDAERPSNPDIIHLLDKAINE